MTVDPIIWYANRELEFIPNHFIKCPTPVTTANMQWTRNKTTGRYAFCNETTSRTNLLFDGRRVYFENERDAMLYELLWAGSSE
jgi:hypothetical protein